MKIAVIGAGAMGSLFGGRLALAGQEVWLLDIQKEQIESIRNKGLVILSGDEETICYPSATIDPGDIGATDLVIIFVKSNSTEAAAKQALRLLGQSTFVLTLQNGIGNAEKLASILEPERILAGTTAQGATLLSPGRILHGGNGATHIGPFSGNAQAPLQNILTILSTAGFEAYTTPDIQSLIWGKLIINVGINALTGITGFKNGQLAEHPETMEVMKLAVAEAAAVAEASNISLPFRDPFEKVLAVAKATAENCSSMLQDLTNGRPTEIDAINGAIVKIGKDLGIPTPVNTTLSLLIKTMETTKACP